MYNFFKWEFISSVKLNNTLVSCLGFFIIVFLLSSSALSNKLMFKDFSYLILWISALLSILLTLDNIFKNDLDNGFLDLYTITTLNIEKIILVKMFVHWLTTGFPLTLTSLVLSLTIDLKLETFFWLFFSLFFGTLSLTFIGTIASSITLGIKKGTVVLSILVLPFYFPTLFFGEKILSLSIQNQNPAPSLICLIGITLMCFIISPFVCSVILKIHKKY